MGYAVVLADREFPIEKPSAAQLLGITQFFSRSLLRARGVLAEEYDIAQPMDIDLILGFLNVLTPEELVGLSVLLLQTKDKKFVKANFDLGVMFEAFKIWGEVANLGEVLKNLVSATPSFMGTPPAVEEKPKPRRRKRKGGA